MNPKIVRETFYESAGKNVEEKPGLFLDLQNALVTSGATIPHATLAFGFLIGGQAAQHMTEMGPPPPDAKRLMLEQIVRAFEESLEGGWESVVNPKSKGHAE